ncbi:hypothetical protein MJO28_003387 [Puccinia striiformis f. sp. tritici]|uniref:Uncharacterized protein n=1 Tax=Puccinia striiformis f. sp. tritici TaxID=168172 RepID=A0ACC0EUM0_9BASI|nr:hypothetical protein MJO28_003387 [Puccinia striiformis f. sp. tritici]KAI7965347.1 hypothetical protein MJO29_003445 [Puccinia striiformis f. sp. tritici]KAI9613433.1 hypothetical protein H4Q26_010037 [Puccinia striiformis f. sp. tritici PST-130]
MASALDNADGMSAFQQHELFKPYERFQHTLNAGGIGGGAGYDWRWQLRNESRKAASVSRPPSAVSKNVNSLIGQLQSMLMAGSMSQTVAQQSMQQLAQSLQMAMTQATACTICFSGQGSQFASVASSTFNQFTSFMSQMQGALDGNLGPIVTPFGSLGQPFRTFFQQASKSSTFSSSSFSNMLSPNFAPVMQSIIPGIGGPLSLLGLKKFIDQDSGVLPRFCFFTR